MVVRLVAIVFFAITVFVLAVAGVVIAVLTGIGLLNVFVVVVGTSLRRPTQVPHPRRERWQPSSFRRAPRPQEESEAQAPEVTVRRQ
jgi:MFS superfamily sulfate permease-like transporter